MQGGRERTTDPVEVLKRLGDLWKEQGLVGRNSNDSAEVSPLSLPPFLPLTPPLPTDLSSPPLPPPHSPLLRLHHLLPLNSRTASHPSHLLSRACYHASRLGRLGSTEGKLDREGSVGGFGS